MHLYMDCITLTVLCCAVNRILSCEINDCHVYIYLIIGVSVSVFLIYTALLFCSLSFLFIFYQSWYGLYMCPVIYAVYFTYCGKVDDTTQIRKFVIYTM